MDGGGGNLAYRRGGNHRIESHQGGYRSGESGQSTVELALVLPVLAVALLAVIQVARVSADYVAVQHAAREAARQASLEPSPAAVTAAAVRASPRLEAERLTVAVSGGDRRGDDVVVTVYYRAPTAVPLVGAAIGSIELTARAVVRRE